MLPFSSVIDCNCAGSSRLPNKCDGTRHYATLLRVDKARLRYYHKDMSQGPALKPLVWLVSVNPLSVVKNRTDPRASALRPPAPGSAERYPMALGARDHV